MRVSTRRTLLVVSAVVLLLLALLSPVHAERDFYKILGVGTDASDGVIKKAFRKLSLKYHPDKNKGDAAAAKSFQDVSEAHEVLSDPDKRATYDLHGEEGLKRDKEMAQRGGGGGSIFDQMFGGGGQGKRRGPDFRIDLPVTLDELYNGGERTFKVNRKVVCKACKGSGAKGGHMHTCNHCKGQGQVIQMQQFGPGMQMQMQVPCPHCGGRGKTAKHTCPVCAGSRQQHEDKALDVVIERGMSDGQEIRFERASEQQPDTIPGDVIVALKQQAHERFTRKDTDLHMTHHVALRDALLGHVSSFGHMDGHRVTINTDGAVTQPDHVKVIKGEGMPHHEFQSDRGDLHVKFVVDFPSKLTAAQQEAIKKLFPDTQ